MMNVPHTVEEIQTRATAVLDKRSQSYVSDAEYLARAALLYVKLQRDFKATNDNLTSVQERSNEQLEEIRTLRRELNALKEVNRKLSSE